MIKKPSFLERLASSIKRTQTGESSFEEELDNSEKNENDALGGAEWNEEEEQEGELPIDMFETRDAIVIRALVAGVSPDDLNISITRDMVVLKGMREEKRDVPEEEYLNRELFWGSFSRSIVLPQEIIIDEAEAKEKHGLLEIKLPKLDKGRSAKLMVRSHQVK